jgi:ligand-binding sensor domain-containing protein/class 3 adenylate cyclase
VCGTVLFAKEQPASLTNTRIGRDITFQRISVEQGLSQPNVYALAQDNTGFIWIATADGLNRYDGSTFKIYRRIPGDKTSISDDFTVSLFVDSKGTLWVGTRDGGVNRFDASSGTFTHFKHLANNARSLPNNYVRAISEDKQGYIWLGTDDGLAKLNQQTGECTTFLAGASISALYSDTDGMLWVGTSAGVVHFSPLKSSVEATFRHNPLQSSSLSGDDVSTVYKDRKGNVWVGTFAHGLNCIAARTFAIRRFAAEAAQIHGLRSDNITTISEDAQQHLWIGTQGGGAFMYHPEDRTFTAYQYDPTNPRSLSGNIVFAFLQDRSGAFWLGTFGTGLNVCSEASRVFRGYVCDRENPNNIRLNAVYAICEDKRSTLWLGTENGLVRLERNSGNTTRFLSLQSSEKALQSINTKAGTAQSLFVRSILEHPSGLLFLATSKGLFSLDPVNMRFTQHLEPRKAQKYASEKNVDNLFSLTLAKNGIVWIGTLGAGIRCFDPALKRFTGHFTQQNSPLSHNIVRAISEDASGRLWIGTRGGGLNCFTPSNASNGGVWKVYRHTEDSANSLSHDAIFSLHSGANNTLWIGTQGGGLCRFDATSEKFTTWKEEQGLANNVVYGIVEDDNATLWMSTHQGLSHFSPESKALIKFKNYDWRDGLQNNEFNSGAFARGREGRLYFGSIQGVNEFYADSIRENNFIPPVVITSFKRFGEEVRLERDISSLDTLRISYKDNFFSLEFAALSFIQSDENRFKYMLEGLDAKWIQAGTRHEVRYTNLSGGEYVFRVKASNNDGLWNTTGRSLRIIVTPPFWETWWFRLVLVCIGSLVLFVGIRARVNLLERRTKELEAQVNKRTLELRESNERLQAANEEVQRQVELLDEQSRETELANSTLQEKNLEIEEERKKADALLLNVLPPIIAERLKAGENTIAERFDRVSVLFADIVGFTELAAERSPEAVVDILNTIFSAFDIFSERYNLEKIKTIGDAYMIVGGVPIPNPHCAEAVADMALEMLQTLEILRYTMKANVQVRIGMNTGPVVAGIIGQKKFTYDLWGDTVNTASRMESHGEAGKIHCTETVYELLKNDFVFEERGEIDIKGKGMMKTYFLLGRLKSKDL